MTAVAIDTNLLLLLVIGRASPAQIGKHRRLKEYSTRDYNLLVDALERAQSIVTTPNTITELSNLADNGVHEPLRSAINEGIAQFAEESDEHYCPSRLAAAQPEYTRLGIADSVWLTLLDTDITLLTADTDLYFAAAQRGLTVVNFLHLRESNRQGR